MKRSLFTIALLSNIISQAQPSPEFSYGLHLKQLPVIPYDSIAVLDDMNPGSAPVRWAQYYFNDNYYVAAGQAYNGQQHLQYGYAQQGHKHTTYEMDASADTSRSLQYFRGSGVGDTAVKIYEHQNMTTPELRAYIQYFYTSSGELDSSYSRFYQADTLWYASYTKNYFTGNRIDSTLSAYTTSNTRFWQLRHFDFQNRLEYIENYSNITGSRSYSGRDLMIYDANGQIEKIDLRLALPGSTNLVPFETVEFHQSPSFGLKLLGTLTLTAYPNPTEGALKVNLKAGAKANYEVLGVQGQSLANGTTQGRIDLHHLPTGIYLVKLVQGMETGMIKVCKK